MWVIRSKNNKYKVGYWIKQNDYMQFEVFRSFDTSEEAIALCSRLNGGQ